MFATGLLVSWLLAGCSGSVELTAESSVFDGLDPDVVSEVFANPVMREKIDSDARPAWMAQTRVISFVQCRDVYRVLTEWLRTGEPPPLAPLNLPDNPEPTIAEAFTGEYQRYEGALASGDPKVLRDQITLLGSCGPEVPVEPGDVSGPTIREALLGDA